MLIQIQEYGFRKINIILTYFYKIFLSVIIITGVFAPFLANNKPIFLYANGEIKFPVLSQDNYLEEKNPAQFSINPIIPFHPSETGPDLEVSPLTKSHSGNVHILGTDEIGRDLFAGIIHGCKYSLMVGILSMLIAGLIGIPLGAIAGYYGDTGPRVQSSQFFAIFLALFPSWFYAFIGIPGYLFSSEPSIGNSIFVKILLFVFLFILIYRLLFFSLQKINLKQFTVVIPLDILLSRILEIKASIPTFLLILAISVLFDPGLDIVILVLGLTAWTTYARYTRGEMLKIKNMEYILAGKTLGIKSLRIIFLHAVPNMKGTLFVLTAFGAGGAILAESGLSFLGIGSDSEIVTWGALLSEARKNYADWWMAIFPGSMLFFTVLSLNSLGENLKNK